ETITEELGRANLLLLCCNATENEKGVINSIVALIPHLYDCNMNKKPEAHFSNFKPSKQTNDSTNRPAYVVDVYEQYDFSYSNVFGEVKAYEDIPAKSLVYDFYRTAVFCKDAIEKFQLKSTLGFQAVGKNISFFVMSLHFNKLYTFTELYLKFILIPQRQRDLLNIIGHIEDLLFITNIVSSVCIPAATDLSQYYCPTIPYLVDMKKQLSTRKRKCSLTLSR
ncbi:hypothetical protein BDF14DRAFT_1724538, partial [Spinellus fusiger]